MRYIESPNRRGRGVTFRLLLEAILQSSQGKNVRFVVSTDTHAKWLWRKVVTMCDCYLSPDTLKLDHTTNKLEFPNGGSLTFMSPRRRIDGQHYVSIIDNEVRDVQH